MPETTSEMAKLIDKNNKRIAILAAEFAYKQCELGASLPDVLYRIEKIFSYPPKS